MRILALHSDFITFEAKKKAIKEPEKLKTKSEKIEECLVVFISVEKKDESSVDNAAKNLVAHVKDIAAQVKTKKIVLYPYVHLSSEPSNPKTALTVLDLAEKGFGKDFEIHRSPFGWYKSFNISVKGHPLSELSREFGAEVTEKSEETESLKKERRLTSYWHIMTPDGKLHDIEKFDFKKHTNLKHFSVYEKKKERQVKQEPPHIKLMRKLELVDYEPASDAGNLRYYPKGRLIKKLLEEYVTDRVVDYGGVEVETPLMYDVNHPTLCKYLARFPARQYQIESDKRTFFLRFAACFGQFLMAHDATISYKNLPLRLYELARYSFRREQSGELAGLRRLRAFTMPDVHALVADMEQAIPEYEKRFDLSLSVLENCGIQKEDVEMALRTTKKFFKDNNKFFKDMVKKFGKPVLLELWDERIFYFVLKYEFNFVDNMGKASALSTDQIDIENGERYNIEFTGKDGKKRHPLILHCSPSGAIERVMWTLLEKAAYAAKSGKTPMLPLWLAPSQVRVIPVSAEKHTAFAVKLAEEFLKQNIRADVDDNDESIGKRIRNAATEWTPYIVVVGDEETKGGDLQVRVREDSGKVGKMSKAKLIAEIQRKTLGKPFKKLALPLLLSKRPIFVG